MKLWKTVLANTVLAKSGLAALIAAVTLAAGASVSLAGTGARPNAGVPGRAAVPWRAVGPGWVLAQYAAAAPEGGHGPQTLYLTSPAGTRYQLASWRDNQAAPQLLAWSPDGARALFLVPATVVQLEQLTLATGAVHTFRLPADWTPVGYTTPRGLNIVASNVSGSDGTQQLARFDLNGKLIRRLGPSLDGRALYTEDGAAFITADTHGVRLVSNNGTLIRHLTVPHTAARTCGEVRWWTASTALVSCAPPNTPASQLWLVPLSGRQPTALTPPRGGSSRDLGDIDAWQLSGGLYLQGAGPCGVAYIFRQSASGAITLIHVPHTVGDNAHVLTAAGGRLLVQAPTSCTGSNSLFWFSPASGAEQWLIRAPASVQGVTSAIPFHTRQNGDI